MGDAYVQRAHLLQASAAQAQTQTGASAIGCQGTEGLPQHPGQTTPKPPKQHMLTWLEKQLAKGCALLVFDLSFVPYFPVWRLDCSLQQLAIFTRVHLRFPRFGRKVHLRALWSLRGRFVVELDYAPLGSSLFD